MNLIKGLFFKVIIYIGYKKEDYIFSRSKKFINSWGVFSYGTPRVACFDGVSKLTVGKYCSFADKVSILLGSNHKLNCVTTYPYCKIDNTKILQDTNERGNVTIGNDVWVGYGATIIGEVKIGDGAIIGAGAVVVKDIPPYAVAVGVPAKVVKYRFTEKEIEELLKIKWWDFDFEKIKNISNDLYGKDVNNFIEKYKNKNYE